MNVEGLYMLARNIRKDILDMTYHSGVNGGHLGGALSCADILAVLYGKIMDISPQLCESKERDRFILSKGHVALAHYAVLAETGFITKEEMMSFEKSGGEFPTHEVMNPKHGIETSSGSLGYGLSIAVGIALNAKIKRKKYNTYVLLGDGECNEGSIWEAVQSAARFKLDNLTAIIDINGQQLDGYTKDIMPIKNFCSVFKGFDWTVIEVDGNNIEDLLRAFEKNTVNKPKVILAKTVKSKGIRSIEGKAGWHHARLNEEQYNRFIAEVGDIGCWSIH